MLWYERANDPFVRANRSAAPLPLREGLDMFQHSRYKYLLHLDGHSYSHQASVDTKACVAGQPEHLFPLG